MNRKVGSLFLFLMLTIGIKAQDQIGFTRDLVENVLINSKNYTAFNAAVMDEVALKTITAELIELKKDNINAASLGSFFSRHQENVNNLKGIISKYSNAELVKTQIMPFDLKQYAVVLYEYKLTNNKGEVQRFFVYEIEKNKGQKQIMTYVFYNEK